MAWWIEGINSDTDLIAALCEEAKGCSLESTAKLLMLAANRIAGQIRYGTHRWPCPDEVRAAEVRAEARRALLAMDRLPRAPAEPANG